MATKPDTKDTKKENESSTESLVLTAEEIAAVMALRSGPTTPAQIKMTAQQELAEAFVEAINRTKPPEKKTAYTRKRNSPYWPKDGSPKLRLKRRMYQHGQDLDDDLLHNSEVEKLNRLKPGKYCSGWVIVTKRRDGGIGIDYPVRTAAQRLKLVNQFGVTKFEDLIDRILDEKANPFKYRKSDDEDDE